MSETTHQEVPEKDDDSDLSNRGDEDGGLVADLVGEVLLDVS